MLAARGGHRGLVGFALRGIVALAAVISLSPAAIPAAAASAAFTVSLTSGPPHSLFLAWGTGFPAASAVTLTWDGSTTGMPRPKTGSDGSFQVTVTIPGTAWLGTHTLAAASSGMTLTASIHVVASSAYRNAVMADKPLAYWRLDESNGNSLVDQSRHGNTATRTPGVTLGASGPFGKDTDTAAAFDGTSGSASVPPLPTTTNFSIEGWSYLNSSAATVDSTNNNAVYAAYRKVYLLARPTGFYASVWIGGTEFELQGPSGSNMAQWTYWAIVRSGSTLTVYRNATVVAQRTDLPPTATNDDLTGTIGANGGVAFFHHGVLDEVAIYPAALAANRVSAHYNAAQPIVQSPAASASSATPSQRLVVPAYASRSDSTYWNNLLSTVPSGCAIILGDKDGPVDPVIQDLVNRTHARGCLMLFYVGSNYGHMNTTNSNGVYVTLDSIHQTIDQAYRYAIDGIFVDEGNSEPTRVDEWGSQATTDSYNISFYEGLRDYIKNRTGVRGTFEILNIPGYQTETQAIDFADVLIKSEEPWTYTLQQTWADFVATWPASKVGMIIDAVPDDQTHAQQAITLTSQDGAGWLFLTDYAADGLQYGYVPHDPLWSTEVAAT